MANVYDGISGEFRKLDEELKRKLLEGRATRQPQTPFLDQFKETQAPKRPSEPEKSPNRLREVLEQMVREAQAQQAARSTPPVEPRSMPLPLAAPAAVVRGFAEPVVRSVLPIKEEERLFGRAEPFQMPQNRFTPAGRVAVPFLSARSASDVMNDINLAQGMPAAAGGVPAFQNVAGQIAAQQAKVAARAVGREFVREVTPGPGGILPGSSGMAKLPKKAPGTKPPSPIAAEAPKQPWEMTRKELMAQGRKGAIIENKSTVVPQPGRYYHVLPSDYQGGDILSAAALRKLGKRVENKWKDDQPRYFSTSDARVVSLHDNLAEAEEFRATTDMSSKIVAIDVPPGAKLTRNAERYPAVEKIPADWVMGEISHKELVRQALSEGKPVPEAVLNDYPDSGTIRPPVQATEAAPPVAQAPNAPAPMEAMRAGRIPKGPFPKGGPYPSPSPIKPAQAAGAPPIQPPPPVSPQPPAVQPPSASGVSGGLMGDLQDTDELVTTMTNPDTFRKIANLPGVKSVMRVFNPAGVAETASEKAVVARAALREEGSNKAIGAFSTLESLGKREQVWGKLDDQLRLSQGPLKGKSLDEVLTYRQKYGSQLTPEQSAWADKFHALEEAKTNLLERNGIEINKLAFDEGGEYVGRRVFGRLDPNTGELVEAAFIGAPGPGRPGAKLGLEKTRVYKDINEALADGFRYLPPDEALYLNIKGAYNRVADKQATDWVMERLPWRSTEIFTLPKASRLVQDALQKMEIAPNRLESLARDMPEVAERLKGILSVQDWPTRYLALRGLKDDLAKMVPSSEAKLFWAVEHLTKQRQTAQQGIQAMERALRGETLPTATISAIERVAVDLKGKLREPTRLTLADLVRAGQEAAEFPKTLEVPNPGLLRKYQKMLTDAEIALKGDPQNVKLGKEARELRVKVGFTKYRLSLGEPFEFSKSPMSILTSERKKALEEALTVLRGEPYETATATGQRVTKFKGGLVRELRIKELEAIKQRKEVAERARTVKFGEASVGMPAFQGKILTGPDAQKIAETLNRAFAAQYGPIENILNATNKVNAISRYFVLAGDMGQFMIQLIAFPVRFPVVTGKSVRESVKALFDPTAQAAYLAANNATIQRSRNLILSKGGLTEYTEAFRTIGWMKKKYSPGRVLVPFQRAWEAALDTAGIELRKGFDHLADTPQNTADLEQFINEIRGVTSSARLGVPGGVREMETAVFLAPRYNRAIAAWAADVARGGIRGDQARKSLGALIAGWSAIGTGITLANGEGWDRVPDHLNPMSPDFMTWDVFGQRVGPGSKVRSALRLLGRITANPEQTVDFVADFARANLAPVPGTAIDILTGRNVIGQPTRPGKNVGWGEGSLALSRNVLAENAMPLWIASAALEGGSPTERTARAGIEFAGGRAYPGSVGGQSASFQWRWKDELAAYNEFPSTKRDLYRKAHPDVDAKLYIMGQVETLASVGARSRVLLLMQQEKVNPKFVRGLQEKEDESDERKALRLWVLRVLPRLGPSGTGLLPQSSGLLPNEVQSVVIP